MAFRTNDFKKTTRKAKGETPTMLYPHQMRDKKTIARLEVAIRMFDALVGRRRGEMDAGSLVDFFGDPRLARGIVACLGQYYRYLAQSFIEVVGSEAAGVLAGEGLTTPASVRAYTYAFVNIHHDGFLTETSRPVVCAEIAEPFGLTARDWDALLYLDGEDNQILTRLGTLPTAGDIAALYNFHALDTALRRADKITLIGLAARSTAGDIRAFAVGLGLKAVVSGTGETVTLCFDKEAHPALRRPGHLARAVLMLSHVGATRATCGHAEVLIGTRRYRLSLGTDAFKALGSSLTVCDCPVSLRKRLETSDTLHRDLLKLRARGEANGWRIKRFPEAVVSAQGVLLPDLRLVRDSQTTDVYLAAQATDACETRDLYLPLSRRAPDAADVLARAENTASSLFALPQVVLLAVPADVRALCDKAASQGIVRTGEAQRALHLLDESPLIEWVKRAADPRVRYVPGVGLCARELVSALSAAEQE